MHVAENEIMAKCCEQVHMHLCDNLGNSEQGIPRHEIRKQATRVGSGEGSLLISDSRNLRRMTLIFYQYYYWVVGL